MKFSPLIILVLVLMLAACGPDKKAVINEICIPNAQDEDFDLAAAAKKRGYDVEDVRAICRKWFREDLKEFSDRLEQMNGEQSDPYAKTK